jgi:hypothetical protein
LLPNEERRRSEENGRILLDVLFVADVVRHIAFMEKISEIQCMSSKLIVKYAKCCGPSRKIVVVDFAFLPPRSIRQNSIGGGLDARNQKEVSGATKPYGEALITVSILPVMVFCRRGMESQDA